MVQRRGARVAEGGERSTALIRSFGQVSTSRYASGPQSYLGVAESIVVWGEVPIMLAPARGRRLGRSSCA